MKAQEKNWKKTAKELLKWFLFIQIFFFSLGHLFEPETLEDLNIHLPRPYRMETKAEAKADLEAEWKTQKPAELTKRQIEDRDSLRETLIKKKAREEGLNPDKTYEAYMIAKYYIEDCYIISENHLQERLRHDEFKWNEINVAISWLINFHEVEYDTKRHTYKMKYE